MDNNYEKTGYIGNTQENQPYYSNNTQANQPYYVNNTQANQTYYSNNTQANQQNYGNNQGAYNNANYSQTPNNQNYGNNNSYPQPTPSNGMAIASLVLGIISIPICCFWGIGLVPGIISIILGVISKPKTGPNSDKLSGVAIGGIVCGIIGSVCSIFWLIYELFIVSSVNKFIF